MTYVVKLIPSWTVGQDLLVMSSREDVMIMRNWDQAWILNRRSVFYNWLTEQSWFHGSSKWYWLVDDTWPTPQVNIVRSVDFFFTDLDIATAFKLRWIDLLLHD